MTPPKKEERERRFSSSEEDSKDGYQPRENLTSSIVSVNPPEQDEEAEASNQFDKYTLANDLEDSEENEMDEDSMHPGSESESGYFCSTLNNSRSSNMLQTVTVNMFVNSEMDRNCAEETLSCSSGSDCEREVPAEEEEDSFCLPDSNSESGYEPRPDKVVWTSKCNLGSLLSKLWRPLKRIYISWTYFQRWSLQPNSSTKVSTFHLSHESRHAKLKNF